jgi:hypothetical protein
MRVDKTFTFGRSEAAAKEFRDALAHLPAIANEAPQIAQLAIRHADRLEQAKLRSLERDRAAFAAKLGEDDARVAALDMRIARHREFRIALESLDARAATEPPATPENTAAIYGRVVTSKGAPLKGVRVVALSAAGKKLGADATDSDGAYNIRLATRSAAAGKAAREAKAAKAKLTVEAYLEVLDAAGVVLHREADPIKVEPEGSAYQEIVLKSAPEEQPDEKPSPARGPAKPPRGPRKKPKKPGPKPRGPR